MQHVDHPSRMRTILLTLALIATPALAATPDPYAARVAKVLKATPLIDGHNDWAETLTGAEGEKRYRLIDWKLTVTKGKDYPTLTACLRASDGTTKHQTCVL